MSGLKPHHEHDGIYIMNADGTRPLRLVQFDFGQDLGPSGGLVGIGPGRDIPGISNLSFSPDGNKLTYAIGFGSRASIIYVVNVDGTGLQRLTDQSGFNAEPSFSH
jgi:Tol biopolymer transport system component